MTAPRPIALPAALLLATASLACAVAAACAFLLIALIVVAGHGGVALDDGALAGGCGAAGCACGTVAALIALTRPSGGLRPLALAGAWALAFAWPLWGALPAAAAATLATAFVVRWGTGGAVVRRVDAPAAGALAAVAFVLIGVAFGGAPPDAVRADTAGAPRDTARADTAGAARDTAPAPATPKTTPDPPATARAPGAAPATLIRRYYRALDRRAFPAAWRLLSPAVRARFGGFEHWRAGFATTLSSRPAAIRVHGGAVELQLVARDRAACGVLVQRFAVRWELRRSRATAVTARRLGVPACAS